MWLILISKQDLEVQLAPESISSDEIDSPSSFDEDNDGTLN